MSHESKELIEGPCLKRPSPSVLIRTLRLMRVEQGTETASKSNNQYAGGTESMPTFQETIRVRVAKIQQPRFTPPGLEPEA